MRFVIALMLAISLAPAALRAQEAAISDVIRDQINAFQADDFGAAFGYASPNIKRLFGSPERFGQMVQDGYPMVYRPAEVDMLQQREMGAARVQRVMIRDTSGQLHFLDYQMIPSDSGWQINGVQIVRDAQVGA